MMLTAKYCRCLQATSHAPTCFLPLKACYPLIQTCLSTLTGMYVLTSKTLKCLHTPRYTANHHDASQIHRLSFTNSTLHTQVRFAKLGISAGPSDGHPARKLQSRSWGRQSYNPQQVSHCGWVTAAVAQRRHTAMCVGH